MGRKFDEIFEECLSALLEGRRSVEESLSLYPSLAAELEPLLRTAAEIAPAFEWRPPAAVQEEARQRFLAAARARRERARAALPPAAVPWWQWASLAAAATATLGVLALLGATLMNEGGGRSFSDEVTVRLSTPTPVPSPVALSAPLAQARVQLEALESAVQQGQPLQSSLIRDLGEANRQIAARLDDPSTVRDRDLAEAGSLASRQYCLLSQMRDQVPPAQTADLEETLAATQDVLERLGVTVPESSSTPQTSPAPSPSPGGPQGSPQPATPTPSPSVCPGATTTPAATPTPQQSPAAATPTPSPSQP